MSLAFFSRSSGLYVGLDLLSPSNMTHRALFLAAMARLRVLSPKHMPLKLCQAHFSSPRLLQCHLLDQCPLGYVAAIPLRYPKLSSSMGHS